MGGDWQKVKVGDIAERVAMGPFGSSIKVETFVAAGVPVISGQHLRGFRMEDNEFNFVSLAHAAKLANANVRRGDVIFTHAGNIGQVAFVPESSRYERYVISQRQFYLRPDTEKVAPEFLVYFFKSPDGQHKLLANASSSGVPSIAQPVTYLRTIELDLPPLPEQRAIARILGTLEDKIELNRRMNETLETMARGLFQSWFVDFDPVHRNLQRAQGHTPPNPHLAEFDALFPEAFEESKFGPIPAGWQVGVLDQLSETILGGDWGEDAESVERPARARCIRGADIPDLQAGGMGKMPTRYLKQSSLTKRSLNCGDLVVEISGGSPTQSTGRPVLVSQALLDRIDAALVCSNFCRLIRLKTTRASKFVYLWLRRLYSNDEFLQYENGTTGIKNLAFTLFSANHELSVPPHHVLDVFDDLVSGIFQKQQSNAAMSDTLAALRDTLLPKLISGELRVKDAERFVEATS